MSKLPFKKTDSKLSPKPLTATGKQPGTSNPSPQATNQSELTIKLTKIAKTDRPRDKFGRFITTKKTPELSPKVFPTTPTFDFQSNTPQANQSKSTLLDFQNLTPLLQTSFHLPSTTPQPPVTKEENFQYFDAGKEPIKIIIDDLAEELDKEPLLNLQANAGDPIQAKSIEDVDDLAEGLDKEPLLNLQANAGDPIQAKSIEDVDDLAEGLDKEPLLNLQANAGDPIQSSQDLDNLAERLDTQLLRFQANAGNTIPSSLVIDNLAESVESVAEELSSGSDDPQPSELFNDNEEEIEDLDRLFDNKSVSADSVDSKELAESVAEESSSESDDLQPPEPFNDSEDQSEDEQEERQRGQIYPFLHIESDESDTEMASALKIAKFTGSRDEDVEGFMESFRWYRIRNQLVLDPIIISHFLAHLVDGAAIWAKTLTFGEIIPVPPAPAAFIAGGDRVAHDAAQAAHDNAVAANADPGIIRTADRLYEVFRAYYAKEEADLSRAQAALWKSTQGADEPVETYISNMQRKATAAGLPANQHKGLIMNGLLKHIQAALVMRDIPDMEQLRRWAQIAEDFHKSTQDTSNAELAEALKQLKQEMNNNFKTLTINAITTDTTKPMTTRPTTPFQQPETQNTQQQNYRQNGQRQYDNRRYNNNNQNIQATTQPQQRQQPYQQQAYQPQQNLQQIYQPQQRQQMYQQQAYTQQPYQQQTYQRTYNNRQMTNDGQNRQIADGPRRAPIPNPNLTCHYCGKAWNHSRENCEFFGKMCPICGRYGHSAYMCRAAQQSSGRQQ